MTSSPPQPTAGTCLFLGSDSGTSSLLDALVNGLIKSGRVSNDKKHVINESRSTNRHRIRCHRHSDGNSFFVHAFDPKDEKTAIQVITKFRPPLVVLNLFYDNYEGRLNTAAALPRDAVGNNQPDLSLTPPTIEDWINLVKTAIPETSHLGNDDPKPHPYRPYFITVLNGCDEFETTGDLDLAMAFIKEKLYQLLPQGTLPIIIPASTVTYGGIRYDPFLEDEPLHTSTVLGLITKFFYWWLSSEDDQWTVCDINNGGAENEMDDDDVDGWCLLPVVEWTDGCEAHQSSSPMKDNNANINNKDVVVSPTVAAEEQSRAPQVVLKDDADLINMNPIVHGNEAGHYTSISRFLLIGDIEDCIIVKSK